MIVTVHVTAADLELNGSNEPVKAVLSLSTVGDDKKAPAQETPEGHAVRADDNGRGTHLTAIIATLRDGRQLRLAREDIEDIPG